MTDTALHLVERVLPEVRIRQWVCSLPFRLRALLGYDRALCAEVLAAFVTEVTRSLREQAKQRLGLRRGSDAKTGAVTFIQRFDSGLRLDVHFHTLLIDGVSVRDPASGALAFHELPEPSHRPTLRLVDPEAARPASGAAEVAGVNIHARVVVHDRDRARLERMRWLAGTSRNAARLTTIVESGRPSDDP